MKILNIHTLRMLHQNLSTTLHKADAVITEQEALPFLSQTSMDQL